jgi:hypothetical protein
MTGRSARLAGSRSQSLRSVPALPMATVTPIAQALIAHAPIAHAPIAQALIAHAPIAQALIAHAPIAQVLVAPVVSMALIVQVTREE